MLNQNYRTGTTLCDLQALKKSQAEKSMYLSHSTTFLPIPLQNPAKGHRNDLFNLWLEATKGGQVYRQEEFSPIPPRKDEKHWPPPAHSTLQRSWHHPVIPPITVYPHPSLCAPDAIGQEWNSSRSWVFYPCNFSPQKSIQQKAGLWYLNWTKTDGFSWFSASFYPYTISENIGLYATSCHRIIGCPVQLW